MCFKKQIDSVELLHFTFLQGEFAMLSHTELTMFNERFVSIWYYQIDTKGENIL